MDYSTRGKKRRRRIDNSQNARVVNKIALLLLRALFAGILIAGFSGAGIAIGLYTGIVSHSPFDELNFDMHDIQEVSYASVILSESGEELERLHGGVNRTFVTINEIPLHVQLAFVAIEDERFFEHNGVDIRGIGRAAQGVIASRGGVTQGASTITQQLIKNVLERFHSNVIYKLQEQYMAVQMERELVEYFTSLGHPDPVRSAKNNILEIYLNTINLGRQNYGVQAASLFYFGKDVSELSLVQGAVLAGITQNPSRFPPDIRPENNWVRTQLVLSRMLFNEFITEEEYEEAINTDVYETIVRGQSLSVSSTFSCFNDALIAQVRDDLMETRGWTAAQAYRLIFTGGLRIYSTQNMEMQEIVDEVYLNPQYWPEHMFEIEVVLRLTVRNEITGAVTNHEYTATVADMNGVDEFERRIRHSLPATDEIISLRRILTEQPQSAFVLIDHFTGHVLAMRGVRGEKTESRAFNRATEATRSPGSQFKPLAAFAPAFDIGRLSPSSVIDDIPLTIVMPGSVFSPGNWWGSAFEGLSTARRGISRSMNVVSVKAMVDYVGVDVMWHYMQEFGFTTLVDGDIRNGISFSDKGPALPLGGTTDGVRLIELAAAYATIANSGQYNKPVLYTRVFDNAGNIILENTSQPRQVLRPTTAYLLIDSMRDTMTATGATGHSARWENRNINQLQIAGKTGTSQDTRDQGFTASTPYFTAGVWIGFDNNRRMVRSISSHITVWRTIMERIHEPLPDRVFERPPGIVTATVCLDSGQLAGDLCRRDPRGNRSRSEVFAVGTVPAVTCQVHHELTICRDHGYIASPSCPSVTRVGLIRKIPIDDITANVSDRAQEFSLEARNGLVCPFHTGFVNDNNSWTGNVTWPDGNNNWSPTDPPDEQEQGIIDPIPQPTEPPPTNPPPPEDEDEDNPPPLFYFPPDEED